MATDLRFTGVDVNTTYNCVDFDTIFPWLQEQEIIGLDTETNVVDSILERELKVVSIADEDGHVVEVVLHRLGPSDCDGLTLILPVCLGDQSGALDVEFESRPYVAYLAKLFLLFNTAGALAHHGPESNTVSNLLGNAFLLVLHRSHFEPRFLPPGT